MDLKRNGIMMKVNSKYFSVVFFLLIMGFNSYADTPLTSIELWKVFPENAYVKKSSLEGRHKFSLQWISWKHFGYIDFKKIREDVYEVEGIQEGDVIKNGQKGSVIKIKGVITKISDKVLSFTGKIGYSVYHIQSGTPCIKEGTFNFKSSGNRKYWRCEKMKGCDGVVTDYIDIYFE